MRHGEAENNVKNILCGDLSISCHLTSKGEKQVVEAAKKLKSKKINLIIASPFERTLKSAEIVAKSIGLPKKSIIVDKRLSEINGGSFNGKEIFEYYKLFSSMKDRFTKTPPGGENFSDIKKRVGNKVPHLQKRCKSYSRRFKKTHSR